LRDFCRLAQVVHWPRFAVGRVARGSDRSEAVESCAPIAIVALMTVPPEEKSGITLVGMTKVFAVAVSNGVEERHLGADFDVDQAPLLHRLVRDRFTRPSSQSSPPLPAHRWRQSAGSLRASIFPMTIGTKRSFPPLQGQRFMDSRMPSAHQRGSRLCFRRAGKKPCPRSSRPVDRQKRATPPLDANSSRVGNRSDPMGGPAAERRVHLPAYPTGRVDLTGDRGSWSNSSS
jgi:hypothetical protein